MIPRPAVWVRVVGPREEVSRPIVGLLDTGALSTILPGDLGAEVGARPLPGPPIVVSIGGRSMLARQADDVDLRIRGREHGAVGEERSFDIPSRALLVWSPLFLDLAVLGSHGFLDRIDELCVRAREEVFEIALA